MKITSMALLLMLLMPLGALSQGNATELANHIRSGDLERLEQSYSVESMAGIDQQSGLNPICLAADLGALDALSFLLTKERNYEGKPFLPPHSPSPMILAIRKGHTEVIQMLFDQGNRMPSGGWKGKSYLFHAITENSPQASLDILIKNGADMAKAKMEMKWITENEEVNVLAQNMTEDIDEQVGLNDAIQEIDVYNINVKAAQMLTEVRIKFKDRPTSEITREENEVYDYRRLKLAKVLSQEQYARLK